MFCLKCGYFTLLSFLLTVYSQDTDVQDCTENIVVAASETGEITSPGYPVSYPNHLNCTWILTTEPDRVIELKFPVFHVEEECDCAFDAVIIYDSYPNEEIGRFCNPHAPSLITSSSNTLTIKFMTDFFTTVDHTGFLAEYKTEPANSECAVLGDPRGVPQYMSYLVPNASFTLFTTMAFGKDGYVRRIDYYAHKAGPTFISFWYPIDGESKFRMRGKIPVNLERGFREYTIPEPERVYIRAGDRVAVHYHDTQHGSLAYEDGEHIFTSSFNGDTFFHTSIHGSNTDPVATPWQAGHEIETLRFRGKRAVALRVFQLCDCNDGGCSGGCSPKCKLGRCNINNAHCSAGCEAGYYGRRCELECQPGLYGEDCSSSCKECIDGEVCDRMTGECPSGEKTQVVKELGNFDLNLLGIALIIVCGVELFVIILIGIPLCRRKNTVTNTAGHNSRGYETPMQPIIMTTHGNQFQRQMSNPASDPPSYRSNDTATETDLQSQHDYQDLNTATKDRSKNKRQNRRQNSNTTQNNNFRWQSH